MNLIDKVNCFFSGHPGETIPLQDIISWLKSQGGIHSILNKFHNDGLGGLVESWISMGNNLPVSTDQISAIFGSSAIQQLADTLGANMEEASSVIADFLPKMVNELSPDGVLPNTVNLLSAGLNILKEEIYL